MSSVWNVCFDHVLTVNFKDFFKLARITKLYSLKTQKGAPAWEQNQEMEGVLMIGLPLLLDHNTLAVRVCSSEDCPHSET